MNSDCWVPAFWGDNSWKLPAEAKERLAEIWPLHSIPALEDACQTYLSLRANENLRPSSPEDGKILLEVAQRARKLADLLRDKASVSARERLEDSIMRQWESGNRTTGIAIGNLEGVLNDLYFLAKMAAATPEVKDLGKRKRPTGSRKEAEMVLASLLWDTWKNAHSEPPRRKVNPETHEEYGPMAQTMRILDPLLGVGSNLDRHFRQISKISKGWNMDNKSADK